MTHAAVRGGVVAESARLRIRHKRLDDAPNDYQWRRDPDIARFDAASPTTLPYSRFLMQLERELALVNPARQVFAIDTASGEHIGNVMYYNGSPATRTAEFGICIGSTLHRSCGLGAEATSLFLTYLWAEGLFTSVQLHTLEWNERAQRAFRRAGFRDVARVLRGGTRFVRMEARREWWALEGSGRRSVDQS